MAQKTTKPSNLSNIRHGDHVEITDGEQKIGAIVVSFFGVGDGGTDLWSVKIDGSDRTLTCPSSAMRIHPVNPVDQLLARHNLNRNNIPDLLMELGLNASAANNLNQTEENAHIYIINHAICLRMRRRDFGPVKVIHSSRLLSEAGVGTMQIRDFSTSGEAFDWCVANAGAPSVQSMWIQSEFGREVIWTPAELEAELQKRSTL